MSPGINGGVRTVPGTMEVFEGHAEANNYWEFGHRTAMYMSANYQFETYETLDFDYWRANLGVWSHYWPALSPNIHVSTGQACPAR